MAKLTLHDAYGRFRADMFLSSLIESSKSTQPAGGQGLIVQHSYRHAYGNAYRPDVFFIAFSSGYSHNFG